MRTQPIFADPVCISKLGRALTKKELETIDEFKREKAPNQLNTTSKNNYVLENKILKNIKKDIHGYILDYFDKVICTGNSITPYITQSWLNYTEPNQAHQPHAHSNSHISGVFYVAADKEIDSIVFYKRDHLALELNIEKHNIFNSRSWKFPVETGDLFLFPSYLIHGVEKRQGTDTRVSLSFNVFFKGEIGLRDNLTELTI